MTNRTTFISVSDISGTSGHNIATKEIVKAFASHDDVDLTLIVPKPQTNQADSIISAVDKVYYLPEKGSRGLSWHIAVQPMLLLQTLRSLDTDVIVSRFAPSIIFPPLFANISGTKFVSLIRGRSHWGPESSGYLAQIARTALALNLRSASKIVLAYDTIKTNMLELNFNIKDEKIEIVPNGVDPRLFSPKNKNNMRKGLELEYNEDDFVIGFVGSFKPRHRILELIEAVEKSHEQNNEIKCLLVGDGPVKESLENHYRHLVREGTITFTGNIPHDSVPDYIAACDVLYGAVDPDYPSNPIKCYEYLSCARPVIATSTPEFQFIDEINCGTLLDKCTPLTIGEAIDDLFHTDDADLLQMGERGREYVIENHTWENIIKASLECRQSCSPHSDASD